MREQKEKADAVMNVISVDGISLDFISRPFRRFEAPFQESLIWKLPASDLLYVGRSTNRTLSKYGIHTIGDLDVKITFMALVEVQIWLRRIFRCR